jgi:hypothetical protein
MRWAILDRTLHYGEHLKLSGPSYRLKGRKLELDAPSGEVESTKNSQVGDESKLLP